MRDYLNFVAAESSSPIWMDNVQCTGSEDVLDQCNFSGWKNTYLCNHAMNDAGVVCIKLIVSYMHGRLSGFFYQV